ncbi:MAG TPA: sialidase family protein [Bryobacteraceae bacterium]|nr:sialidase family protein [Bryobacteraceae bacterium]
MLTLHFLLLSILPLSAGVPNRQPQLAAANGQVVLTFAAGQSIYFASSRDEGRTFGPPTKVAEVPFLAVGRHRGPRAIILKDAIVISAIAGAKPGEGDLITWRSVDRGKTWTRAGLVNDEPNATHEGLYAMAAVAQDNLFAAWLDLRSQGTKLYGARSTDGGNTWSKNVLLYASPSGTICQCCDPSIAIGSHGEIAVMWRNVLDGSRDLYLASSRDGIHFGPPQKLGQGTWKLNACPMDGGGLVWDHGQLLSAWRREKDVFEARPGQPEKRLGTGKDVAIVAGKKGVYVAWSGSAGVEIIGPADAQPRKLAPEGGFVNLVALEDGSVLAAWESDGAIQTAKLNGQ